MLAAEIVSFPFVSFTVIAPLTEIVSESGVIVAVGATGTCGFSTVTTRPDTTGDGFVVELEEPSYQNVPALPVICGSDQFNLNSIVLPVA